MKVLPYFVILPLAGSFLVIFIDSVLKDRKVRDTVADILANVIMLTLFILTLTLFGQSCSYFVGGWRPPFGINFLLDGLSHLMLVAVNLIALLSGIFSINYMSQYTARRHYWALFLLMLTGMNGVLLSGDFFNLFVFLEIASVASYALVGFGTEAEELEASFKYMVMGAVASSLVLMAVAVLYSRFGILNMSYISAAMPGESFDWLLKFSLFLFITAFSIKGALVPFHAWLPDAHPSAPAPVSAMLSGVLIETIGIYALTRVIFNVFSYKSILLANLGVISMMVGVLLALGQTDIKRLLAYSSISQVGYIVLGLGLGTPLGIFGALFHLINHSIFKSLLFLNSGSVFYRLKTRDLNSMGGLNKVMPVTGATSLVASLSISGLPPFNGFFSKLIIIIACVQSGHPVLAVWAVIGSVLTLAYFMKVQKLAFFGKLKEINKEIKESPFFMSASVIILAALCLATSFILLPGVRNKILTPAVNAVLNPTNYRMMVYIK
ncbi:MAG: NADH/ubiquinone/plastoquinone (complex I) [Elusimicrobia bacterium CG08_land_8_20_14_0_20_44_26]|nr:MAG: NADH/ubiquinone/plastoquinone (complex I) [Elusimicrobia bacterium CG08_land_8_20_14_0_20_44_26]